MWLLAGGLGLLQASGRAGVSSQAATHLATATSHLPALDLQDQPQPPHLTALSACCLSYPGTVSLDITGMSPQQD